MGRGFLLSGLLHVTLVAMLYFGMSAASRLPPAEEAISVEVVAPEELGEAAPAPAPAETSPKPEREAASPAPPPPPPPPPPEPKPEPPAPPPAPPAPRVEPEPAAQEVAKLITEEMEPPPEPAPPPPPPAPEAEAEPEPPPPAAPVDEPEPAPPPPEPEPEAAEAPPEPATPTPRLKPVPPRPEPPKAEPPKAEPSKPEPSKPEPKVAEAKPAPKPEPKAEEEPKPDPEPKPAEDRLAQILRSVEDLNKRVQDDVARPGEGRAPPAGIPGQARNLEGEAAAMSRGEVDALKRQIEACWIVPRAVPGIEDMVVRLRISLQPDRRVRDVRVEDQGRIVTDPGYRVVAESAERAVLSCSPLRVPLDKYQLWREIVLTFTLRDILSG